MTSVILDSHEVVLQKEEDKDPIRFVITYGLHCSTKDDTKRNIPLKYANGRESRFIARLGEGSRGVPIRNKGFSIFKIAVDALKKPNGQFPKEVWNRYLKKKRRAQKRRIPL